NPGDPANAILFGDVPTGAFTISETALEAAQSNVLIQATDQIVLANLTTDGVLRMRSNVSLTLQTRNDASQGDLANGGILFQNTANTIRTQGTGKLVLQAGVSATASGVVTGRNGSANISAGSLTSATGAIQLEATGTIAAARSIVSTGGAITVAAGGEIQIAAGAELTSTNNSIQLTSTGGKIVGASNVVLTAGNQIQIDSKTTAAGNVSLSANDGIRLGANLTANGTLTVNADKNLDGVGTFQVLPGAIVSTTGGAITVTSADIDLQGGLSSSAGTTTL
ncbi:MAG: hypothetical protein NT069_33490, partial [Planctomycetota bacterium]|nr:hypothetical protein [Planctomycetota bacterium]